MADTTDTESPLLMDEREALPVERAPITHEELARRRAARDMASASLALEGIDFPNDERALFDHLDRLGYSHDERIAYFKALALRDNTPD